MSNVSYSERQIEAENLLRSVGGEEGVPVSVIDQVVALVGDELRTPSPTATEQTETSIRLKLLDETDWRKRASLCALLISRSLE